MSRILTAGVLNQEYIVIPSPTPTMTPTITPTITPTVTPTVTPTNTVTPTISLTPSITPTITPTITVTPSITPSTALTTLKSGLLSCWNFDETSGTSFYDSYGSQILTGLSVTANAEGKIGRAVDFSGNTSYLTLPTDYKFTGAFGFSLWFYADSWNASYPGLFGGGSFCNSGDQAGVALAYFKTVGIYQGLWLDLYSSTYRWGARINSAVSTGVWHHVAGGYDGISKLYYYLDGVKSTIINSPIGVVTISWTGNPAFRLGATHQPKNNLQSFDGKIDQTAFWNRMLSDAEMLQLYNSGNGFPYSSW